MCMCINFFYYLVLFDARTGFFHPHVQLSRPGSSILFSPHRNLTPDDQNAVDNSMVMTFPVDSTLNVSFPQ